jgi:hypothetical protein
MDINFNDYKSIEEDSSRGRNSKRDSRLVRDCQLPFYEDHLGAERLKTSKPFRRHALYALSDVSFA